MRRSTCLLLASGLLVACSSPSTEPAAFPSSTTPDASDEIVAASRSEASYGPLDLTAGDVPSGAVDPSRGSAERLVPATPDSAAAQAVVQLLEDEELLVLNLDSNVRVGGDSSTVVLVRVLFGTGRSHPQQVTYRVRVAEGAAGWFVVDLEVAA